MFRKACLRGLALLSVVLASWDARAEGVGVRPEFSLRSGYGVPFGGTDAHHLRDTVSGQVPLWFDAGARIAERFFVGAYAQYSISFLGDGQSQSCRDEGAYVARFGGSVSCEVHGSRLGVESLYHAGAGKRLDPWVGVGTGYEWLTLTETTTGVGTFGLMQPHNQTVGWTSHGFESFNLQFGLDVLVVGPLAVGPFVALTMAHYRRVDASCSGDCDTTVVVANAPDGDLHTWLYGGARTTLVF